MKHLHLFSLFFLTMAVLIAVVTPAMSQNAVPMLLSYQGELKSPSTGTRLDGTYEMVFRIYSHPTDTGATALVWEETHAGVEVADGIFSVILGSVSDLFATDFDGPDRWLEIEVAGETLEPRQRMTSVAYSIISEDSRLLEGREASEFADAVHAHSGSDITAGIVSHERIDATIARDSETDAAVAAHAGIPDAHHARYTDTEAVAAMGAKADANPLHHDKTTIFTELSGTASDSQIPSTIARNTEVDSKITDHAAVPDAHHTKTTTFAELKDTATDAQIPNDITVTYAAMAGDADTVDGMHGAALEESAEIDADIAAHAGIADAHHGKTTSLPWGSITSIPAGFADGIDNDSGATSWSLTGNSGTTPGAEFLGTTDNQALELRVNNTPALRLEPTGTSPNIVAGYQDNAVSAGVRAATIGGGGASAGANVVTDSYGTIGGGLRNQAGDNAGDTYDAEYATVGGGQNNTASGADATVSGGSLNEASGMRATVAGGAGNTASGSYSAVGGGQGNTASGTNATVGGGSSNTASGINATVAGGVRNTAWSYSFAAGRRAKANHRGSFVWADSTDADFSSRYQDEFNIRAAGGVRVESDPGIALNAADTPLITRGWDPFGGTAPVAKQGHGRWGVFMEPNALVLGMPAMSGKTVKFGKYAQDGTYTQLAWVDQSGNFYTLGSVNPPSDRALKKDFAPVNPRNVLDGVAALPLQTWAYTNSPSVRHLGPVAQDFHAAFGLGADDKHIATVDADGVALAAIQGLHEIVQEKDAEISSLKSRIEALEDLVEKLVESQGGEE